MNVTMDCREGVRNLDIEKSNCCLEEAVKFFSALDGSKHTLMCVERDDLSILSIGGGAERFVVTHTNASGANATLKSNASTSAGLARLCAGGQYADFPSEIVVDQQAALNALKLFFDRQEGGLHWKLEV